MRVNIYRATPHDGITLKELELYHLIMEYRASLGLPAIPLSKALSTTAGRHVVDTRENVWAANLALPAGATLHSWSDAPHFADRRNPEAMWEAPARLGTGYDTRASEISTAGFATPKAVLDAWRSSPSHDAIIANTGVWASRDWKAIGVGFEDAAGAGPYGGRVAHVWFGTAADASGSPRISGTERGDTVRGTDFGDNISGLGGNDTIRGGKGNDVIRGDAGDDALYGDAGGDVLYGGSGNDVLYGNGGNDRLHGDSGHDVLWGGAGNDVLRGGGGNDRLLGGAGNDQLFGGDGRDTLIGGSGKDHLAGGAGADTFVFKSPSDAGLGERRDVITDFARGSDRIDLAGIDANTSRSGDQAFSFIGGKAFTNKAGELRYDGKFVAGDVNGDGRADFEIELVGIPSLSSADFLL